jgi:hypothetical protein
MDTNLNKLAKEITQYTEKMQLNKKRSLEETVTLCCQDLEEALQEYYADHPVLYIAHPLKEGIPPKPDGQGIKLADCIIHLLDYCGRNNININDMISVKNEYNRRIIEKKMARQPI